METDKAPPRVPIPALVKYYLRLGLLGFGGPVALVGQMEREMVGEKKWLTKDEMREGIAVCQSLPGPLAIQVGIWIPAVVLADPDRRADSGPLPHQPQRPGFHQRRLRRRHRDDPGRLRPARTDRHGSPH